MRNACTTSYPWKELHITVMLLPVQESGVDAYDALQQVRLQTLAATPDQAFWAGGDVRIGEFILLVDSDTRVPEDCMLPVVSELLRSPHVGFTQHFTTPLQARARSCPEPALASGAERSACCSFLPVHAGHTRPCAAGGVHSMRSEGSVPMRAGGA